MKTFLVEINYQSTSGRPLTFTNETKAENEEKAIEICEAIVKRRKNYLKIHGGSVLQAGK